MTGSLETDCGGFIRPLTMKLYPGVMVKQMKDAARVLLGALASRLNRSLPKQSSLVAAKLLFLLILFSFAFPSDASAQSATVSNTTTGTINGTTTCSAPLIRNFSVSSSFTVSDVNIGVLATHTWRGDLRMTLQSPTGTRVQIVNGDINNISGENFNVLLDDAAGSVVNTDGNTINHSTGSAPPYQNTFRPNGALSAFNGQNSSGTWRLEICDLFPSADDGQFNNATLYLSGPTADLSLAMAVSNATPANGAAISYTLTVTNSASSTGSATGVQVRDFLPAGFSFASSSGTGTFNSSTGLWTVGSVPIGTSRSITINGTVNATAGATITNVAEIITSSLSDPDSTVNNGSTIEDDYASRSFTVSGARVAGTPPTLFCQAGSAIFDWDAVAWTAGSTNNSYPLGTLGNINFALSNQGIWLNNAAVGGQSPSRQNIVTGGQTGSPFSLLKLVDMPNQSALATTVITLPRSVMGAQFTIFDVDYAANQFADRVTVTGSYKGASVVPTLTNGIANYVIGNTAYGDGDSPSENANGNLIITFDAPIDQITVQYGNHSLAPADPGQQGIALYDMTFCMPTTTLSATKVSTVFSDPINNETNPKAIPGAVIDYVISVSNTGNVEADDGSVSLVDIVPAGTKFCLADLAASAGPLLFQDPAGNSGLSYSYVALGDTGDDLSFSNDGGLTYTYSPTADSDGCDANITHFRVTPSGAFVEGTGVSLRARFMVN